MPGVPHPSSGIGHQTPTQQDSEIVWTPTQPWHFYVVLGVALVLTVVWALLALRREAVQKREAPLCSWCGHFGCWCSRKDKGRRGRR